MALEQDYTFQYKDTGLQLNRDLFPGQVGIPGAINLVSNPNAKAPAGEFVLWQNLVTNPSAITTFDEVVVRKNHCPNPRASASVANWTPAGAGTPGNTTFDRVADNFSDSTYAFLLSADALGTANDAYGVYFDTPATPGSIWSVRLDGIWRDLGPDGVVARLGIEFRGASGAIVINWSPYHPATSTDLVEMREDGATAPAGTTTARVYVQIYTTGSISEYVEFRFKNVLLEQAAVAGSFFDGASAPPSSDFTMVWTGATYLSTSEQRAPGVDTWFPSAVFTTQDYQVSVPWTQSGKAVKVDRSSATGTHYLSSGGSAPLAAGEVATVLAKAVASGPGCGFQIAVQFLSGSGGTVDLAYGPIVPATAGEVTELRYTGWAAPAGTVSARLVVYLRAADGGGYPPAGMDLTVGDALLVLGEYAGPFFDGSTPALGDFTYAWTGPANASTSELRALDPPNWGGNSRGTIWCTEGGGVRYLVQTAGFSLESHYVLYDEIPRIAVSAGGTYTLLVRIEELPLAYSSGAYLRYQWYDAANTFIGQTDGPNTLADENGTLESRAIAIAPANAASVRAVVYPIPGVSDVPAGTEYVIRYLAIIDADYSGPYFDGSFPGEHYVDQNFTLTDSYYWTGEPDASTSVYAGQPELSVGDTLLDVERVNGLDSADTRLTERVREGMDGGFADAEFENMRTIVIDGTAYGSADTLLPVLEELKANYAPGKNSNPFYLRAPGIGERVIFAKALGARYNWEQALRTGKAPFQIQLKAEDPTIYGDAITLTTGVATVSTGRGYNKSYNYGYGGVAGSGGTVNAYNNGTKAVPAIITLRNVMNPSVVHDGLSVRLNFEITLNDGDWLDIDLRNRTVRLNGSANRRGTLKGGSRWFLLEVGDNALRFLGNPSGTGAPSMTVTYRPGYR